MTDPSPEQVPDIRAVPRRRFPPDTPTREVRFTTTVPEYTLLVSQALETTTPLSTLITRALEPVGTMTGAEAHALKGELFKARDLICDPVIILRALLKDPECPQEVKEQAVPAIASILSTSAALYDATEALRGK